jgi:hypothetical protein
MTTARDGDRGGLPSSSPAARLPARARSDGRGARDTLAWRAGFALFRVIASRPSLPESADRIPRLPVFHTDRARRQKVAVL